MGSLGLYFVLYSQLVDPWYGLLIEPLAGTCRTAPVVWAQLSPGLSCLADFWSI